MVEKTVTFQQTVPRRPALADILNGEKENVGGRAVPPHFPAAEEFMQMGALLAAYGRMVPLLRISVAIGDLSTAFVQFATTVRDDVLIGNIVLTQHGPGDVSLVWPAGKFPASSGLPVASTNRGTSAGRSADAELITNGVRVRTCDAAGAADLPFTVLVF